MNRVRVVGSALLAMVLCALGIGPSWAVVDGCAPVSGADYFGSGFYAGTFELDTAVVPPTPDGTFYEWSYWYLDADMTDAEVCDTLRSWETANLAGVVDHDRRYIRTDWAGAVNGLHQTITGGGSSGQAFEAPWSVPAGSYRVGWTAYERNFSTAVPDERPPVPTFAPVEPPDPPVESSAWSETDVQALGLAASLLVFLAAAGFTRSFAHGAKA